MRRWRKCACLVLAAVMAVSLWQLWKESRVYAREAEVRERLEAFRPAPAGDGPDGPGNVSAPVVNQGVVDAQALNGDVRGWLTVDGTNIDYPFVQGEDNDYYLRRDLFGEALASGTVFLDFRCPAGLTGPNTILYGHHMKNGSMFGDIRRFADRDYFDAHRTGTVYLANKTLRIEIVAYLVVDAMDAVVYDPDTAAEDYWSYIEAAARRRRDAPVKAEERMLTLSTCNYETGTSRAILAARILPEET